MMKTVVLLCVFCVVIEARPKWQYLPAIPGYVPVYIRPGDTPLEEINPDLAEAFHALPAGRSAGKLIEASEDQSNEQPDQEFQPEDQKEEIPNEVSAVDHRPYEKKVQKKKATEIVKPIERR